MAAPAPEYNADGTLRRRAGRPPSATWALLTDTPNAHKLASAVCRSCKREVNYHKKREAAEAHLNKCPQFWDAMMALPADRRPDWFGVKKQKPAPGAAAAAKAAGGGGAKRKLKDDAAPGGAKREKLAGALVAPNAPFTSSAQFQELMAMHFYATGTPLTRVADPHLVQAIATLQPEAQLPTPEALAGPLLDACYRGVQEKAALLLGASGTNACVVSADGGGGATNYMVVTPRKTLFLHTDASSTQATGETVASGIATVIQSITGSGVVVGATTANTPAHMRAWTLLSKQYPSRFFHGCVSHLVQLVVQDLFDAERSDGADDVEAFKLASLGKSPFKSSLVEFAGDCRDVVHFFAVRPQLSAQLELRQRTTGASPLAQATLQQRFATLLESASHLVALVRDKHFGGSRALSAKEQTERQRVKSILSQSSFVGNLTKSLSLLQPLDKLARRFARTNVPVSEVVPAFQELTQTYGALVAGGQLSAAEGDYISALVTARLGFFRREAHDFGYLLDPRFLGDNLLISQRRETEDALFAFPVDDASTTVSEEDALVTADEYTNFSVFARADRSAQSTHFQLLLQGKRSPLQFWQLEGAEWPRLQQIALKVFSMAASTAAATRSVATLFEEQKRADAEDGGSDDDDAATAGDAGEDAKDEDERRLFAGELKPRRPRMAKSPETVEKLVYIRANAAQLAEISAVRADSASAEAPRGHVYYESEDIAII